MIATGEPTTSEPGENQGVGAVRKTFVTSVVAALVVVGVAGNAAAAKPTIERISVTESVPDEFLSEECGVDVTASFVGRITFRTFERSGPGPVELTTINLAVTLTAEGNTYRLRDVGADMVRIEPDGTAVLMIIGQVPFGFKGVLKIDLETGDVILEPRSTTAAEIEKACAALTS